MRIMLLALVFLAACGKTESTTQPIQAQTEQPSKAVSIQKAPEGQPRYIMVKVPVDSTGKEDLGAAESRIVNDGAAMATATGAKEAFESAKAVTLGEELDRGTSTESWGYYWRRPYYGYGYGYGYGYSYRNPYLYYNNYSYAYNYGNYYNYGGCNYHYWYNY
ncbi:MAG: hypothetical protein NTV34_09155 [Proteobacteria bacterium]|nr:hypothetical protein [Pseudomonadota bacterium]